MIELAGLDEVGAVARDDCLDGQRRGARGEPRKIPLLDLERRALGCRVAGAVPRIELRNDVGVVALDLGRAAHEPLPLGECPRDALLLLLPPHLACRFPAGRPPLKLGDRLRNRVRDAHALDDAIIRRLIAHARLLRPRV